MSPSALKRVWTLKRAENDVSEGRCKGDGFFKVRDWEVVFARFDY
jgi:hypothetical protein